MTRRQLLAAAAGSLVSPAQTRRPNIIFILADDLGYADLACTGDPSVHSPNIDAIARDGVRFTDFTVCWPACTPSRSAILTGRYPQRNGLYDMIRNNEVNWKFQFDEVSYATSPEMTLGLDLREITVGQVLKDAGYRTGVVGKWDSGRARRYLPLQRGFDFFYGFANTGIDYYTHERYGVPSMFRGNERVKEEGHATDLFAREARGFIRRAGNDPYFLYLPFNAPHGASTFDKTARQEEPKYLSMYPGDRRALYKAWISHLDDAVGAILEEVRERRQENDTLVVFSSDNGGTGKRNGPLRGGKSSLWEGGYRVPFLARWPGKIPKGGVSGEFATSLELLPTFAALAGARLPPVKLDGFDLMPAMQGNAKSPRTEMFWHHRGGKAARSGRWKWLDATEGRGLFDLAADPGESADLSASKPEVAALMRDKWTNWRREMDASEPRGPFRDY
jgi:arylsulfatase A-like enzyme